MVKKVNNTNNMAELIHIGKHCMADECHQLDFLPIECLLCHKQFCKLHIKGIEHHCEFSNDKLLTAEEVDALNSPASFPCSLEKCKQRELTPIQCDDCHLQFCLKHRLPVDHDCKYIKKVEKGEYDGLTPQQKVQKITGKTLVNEKSKGRVGKKSKKTSSKVQEMKLKMKGKGENSIPVDERIYFDVKINIEKCATKSTPLFFSREYTVGKIIDLIAKYIKLSNENHILHAPKLRLYLNEGDFFAMDVKLKMLLENDELEPFGEIHIKYVT